MCYFASKEYATLREFVRFQQMVCGEMSDKALCAESERLIHEDPAREVIIRYHLENRVAIRQRHEQFLSQSDPPLPGPQFGMPTIGKLSFQ